ncbi:N(4)-(Beta-N-acetylglucosaminyl)-L-asparaginase isoform X2 [Plodia interpunctella]|uniref:N(4)-(Beta-N-acetylglucosaminyl)-L-asparaginase isoform X2 n=1 Tax=Plodia interpunctella TaxID=58824 RepID=UPI0023679770|nr:N(4)-(Beta-N-acetylglucosaminyl)-L-asparaginase isoform X2 [Plodia interpunctella]
MLKLKLLIFLVVYSNSLLNPCRGIPIVITTWRFTNATARAWDILSQGGTSLDAVEKGASVCEELQCDLTVGYGGSPDENGETTLDAMIMDGKTMNVGAVGALRRIKNVISVARHVLEHSKHSFLVGELATEFALQMGFTEESLTTPESKKMWMKWRNEDNCQPNFWMKVQPDPTKYCGPYEKLETLKHKNHLSRRIIDHRIIDEHNHDTIGMVAIDHAGNIAAGTSTNGAKFKMPGRIGDSPIPGAGAYADNNVGGAAATGDGDVMLRFLPSFLAVEEMRRGSTPQEAALTAVKRIVDHYPAFMGAVIAISKNGKYGAACNGIPKFPFVVQDGTQDMYRVNIVDCL